MDVGLRELFNLIWRRRLLIAGISCASTMLAALILFNIAPRYTAEALVLIDSRAVNVVNLETAIAALPRDAEGVKSEIEILASRGLAERVVERLGLHHVDEFNEGLEALEGATLDTGFQELPAVTRTIIINRFLGGLAVSQRGGSRVITIEYTSTDAVRAAKIANALADVYQVGQLEAKFDATKRASSWLSDQIGALQEDLVESERAVERYRDESGLLQARGERLSSQEITELNTAVLKARTATAEAEARLAQIEGQLQDPVAGARTAAAVLDSDLIQRLTEQEADIRRRLAELSTEYGELHPRMVSLRAEAKDLNRKIRLETDKVVAGLRYELAVAGARENTMVKTLETAKGGMADANQAEIGLRALEREANANRVLLETMMARFAETSAQDSLLEQQADSRVISRAQVPASPSFPMTTPLLAIAAIGGALLGLLTAFGLEAMDQSIRSGEEIEGSTGMPSLGFIPEVEDAYETRLADYVLRSPDSPFAESIRNLLWGLKLRWHPKGVKGQRKGHGRLPKSILITSSMTNEGKTTIATSMARLMAGPDCKVLLIDADCRRPSVHEQLQLVFQPGLSELLTGQADFNTVMVEDEKSYAKVIPAGCSVADAPGLFGSTAFDDLMRKAERMFDLIIIDSPPIMVGADAAILSKKVAATVVAVRWGSTEKRTVEAAIHELQADDDQLLTTVLSVVDASKHSRFSYGDSGKYAGKLASYYGRSRFSNGGEKPGLNGDAHPKFNGGVHQLNGAGAPKPAQMV